MTYIFLVYKKVVYYNDVGQIAILSTDHILVNCQMDVELNNIVFYKIF